MSKMSVTSLIILSAAVAACSDSATHRTVTAPDVGPALSEEGLTFGDAPAYYSFGFTADGPLDVFFAADDAFGRKADAQIAAAPLVASSRATGHVGLSFTAPVFGVVMSQNYSFVAASTPSAPAFTADGEYEMMLTSATGRTNKVHGNVICMGTSGNTARIAGQITKLWVNNVQVPIAAATHNIWVVVDNGEGQAPPDQVSLMGFTNAATAQLHCAAGTPTVVFPNQAGNVQVQP
jgi:hypothetical protein